MKSLFPQPTHNHCKSQMQLDKYLLKLHVLNENLIKSIKTNLIIETKLTTVEMIDLNFQNNNYKIPWQYEKLSIIIDTNDLFDELNSLHSLKINFCKINRIPLDTFDCLSSNLRVLELRGCYNNQFDPDLQIISKLNNLIKLDISGSYFNVEKNPFDHMNKLEILKLNRCSLRYLTSSCFKNLTNLRSIELEFNRLEKLPEDLFKYNTKLESILLSWNYLKILNKNQFSNLKELKELHLECNALSQINKDTFINLDKLELLFLSDNNIKHLNGDEFDNLKSNCKIYLECFY